MNEQLWSVWICDSSGMWWFDRHVSTPEVMARTNYWGMREVKIRIHPRHRNSISDIREG